MTEPSGTLNVNIDKEASPEEVAAVRDAFAEVGIEADVRAEVVRLSVGDLPWAAYVSQGVEWILQGGLAWAGGEGAKRLARLVKKVAEARGGRRGQMMFQGKAPVVLTTDLPNEAYLRLEEMPEDLRVKGSYWVWDFERGAWWDKLGGGGHWPSEP